jgi:tetratricopeptide (TPR) repeat protein
VSVALQEGQRLLYSGHAALAIPAALQAVRYLTELGSPDVGVAGGVADIAPAYLILSEAAIQLGRVSEAEQYLSQVQWLVLQTPSPPPSLLASLHRNLGQLAVAQGRLPEARRHFAEDVYQSSVAHGTDSTQTASGYFHMAMVFSEEGRPDIATSLHDQVVESWHTRLSGLAEITKPQLEVGTQAQAMYILQSICDLQERSPQAPPTPLLFHTLALLHHIIGNSRQAVLCQQRAVDLCPQEDTLHSTLQSFLGRLTAAALS